MYAKNQTLLLLPQLKEDCDVSSGDRAGQWNLQPSKAFNDVATSLKYNAPGAVKNISSVPTMWARPLTIEMVLYDGRNSLHPQMVEQWQGMLATIALAEARGFPLKAQLIELEELQGESFAESLFALKPDYQGRNLYTLPNKHPWQDLYVFLWGDKPVGITSPSTLVVPSEQADWGDLPWWKDEKRLKAPVKKDANGKVIYSFLQDDEQALLWNWLSNLSKELNNHGGDSNALNIIKGLIGEFQNSLKQNPEIPPTFSSEEQFFGERLNRGALIALNYPVKAPAKPSSVSLLPSKDKTGKKLPLLIYDPEIARIWNETPQNIWIHEGKTLASLKPEELGSLKTRWLREVVLIDRNDLFLPELRFIDLEEALPGGLFPDPKASEAIIFNNRRVTPLIPLNPLLLDYLTPEELVSRIKFQPQRTPEGMKVRLILTLHLSGNKGKPEPYIMQKDYPLKEENSLGDQLPVLQIWPNFRAEDWKEYYTFYYDAELGEETFNASFPDVKHSHNFKEDLGNYQINRLETFPEYMNCQDNEKNLIGLILLKSPNIVQKRDTWHVGVDFGTSFTNIYVRNKGLPESLILENLQLQITNTARDTRINTLFENFLPESFIPQEKPLPLSSVLTTKGSNPNTEKMLPILDGRFYVPDNRRFEPKEKWIKTDLKWSKENIPFNELFLKHIALHIAALAANSGAREIQWYFSYPSAFSRGEVNKYAQSWKDLIEELKKTTGIEQNEPERDSENFRTESLAVAQYFADFEGHNLVFTTCIDMGGGTSDISIWDNNTLVHQCSVQLAGRDIFSQFLSMNPKFIEQRFKEDSKKWRGLSKGAFNAKIDVWLRLEGDNWLNSNRTRLQDEADLQGLVRLTAIGMAGLYYYVGIILKVLHEKERYSRPKITPVYIGGNGSRFLKWLDERGKFDKDSTEINELLSRMLSAGSGFEETVERTRLSNNPKDEAVCGLVLSDKKKLKGLDKKTADDPLIAGEGYIIETINQEDGQKNRQTYESNAFLKVEDDVDVTEFKVAELVELPKFLYEFHKALKDFKIEGILPLKGGYVRSPERDKNKKLWEDTQRELDDILLEINGQSSDDIRLEPPFILGLKALLKVLGKMWAEQ